MNETWQKFVLFVNEKSLRERAIILVVIVVLVYGLTDLILLGGMSEKNARKDGQLTRIENENKQVQQEIEHLSVISDAKTKVAQQKTAQLQAEIDKLDSRLAAAAENFVPAALMAEALSELLKENTELTLLRLENMPVEEVIKKAEEDKHKNGLYRHGIELQLKGGFIPTLKYIKLVEALRWRFQWETIVYDVQEYPVGVTTIEIYTYSTDEDWLGV